jgi:hypothetical protein
MENPATHSECNLLFLVCVAEFSNFNLDGTVAGNASLKLLDKPVEKL